MHINNGWLVEAQDGHYGAKSESRQGYTPKYIVLHGTAGGASAAAIDNYFTTGGVAADSHVIIDQAGVVIQGVSFDLAAWGNGILNAGHAPYLSDSVNPNLYTISIEHVKSATDNSNSLTPAQQAASFDVIKSICDAYGIPERPGDANGGIIKHADIDPINRRDCPGSYPWDALWTYLANQSTSAQEDIVLQLTDPMGSYFIQSAPDTWTCKANKIVVKGAILNYYRATLGACRLPVTAEQYTIPDVCWQRFESGILVYDPNHRLDNPPTQHNHTYLLKLDSDLTKQILGITALQQQIANLQQQLAKTDIPALKQQLATTQQQLSTALAKITHAKTDLA